MTAACSTELQVKNDLWSLLYNLKPENLTTSTEETYCFCACLAAPVGHVRYYFTLYDSEDLKWMQEVWNLMQHANIPLVNPPTVLTLHSALVIFVGHFLLFEATGATHTLEPGKQGIFLDVTGV